MDKTLIVRVFITLLILYCLFFILPILIALIYQEYDKIISFVIPAFIVFAVGLPVLYITRGHKGQTNFKQGLLLVPLCWIAVSLVGSIPYLISGEITSFSSAFFETSSGLTTTGASVLTNIESMSKTILFWRALTHWLGGMGIVVLVVALFPQVGMGGNILLASESPGPSLEKITPKIHEMAKIFWFFYTILTVVQSALLMFGGMYWFDAITHSFATLATGGFSTQNNSIAAYSYSPYIQTVITIFMILAGTNFAIYFSLSKKNVTSIWKDTEFRVYLSIIVCAGVLVALGLLMYTDTTISQALQDSFFQVASILTTTGFVSADYEKWPYVAQGILFFLMFIGGCAGSTGGGIKIIRVSVLIKYIRREIVRIFSPMRIQVIKVNKRTVDEEYVRTVLFFILCYVLLLLIVSLIITFDNHDLLTSFSTALATLGNIGPGFGSIGPTDHYVMFAPWLKIFLSMVMITGRLELFTVIIIFSPRFWK